MLHSRSGGHWRLEQSLGLSLTTSPTRPPSSCWEQGSSRPGIHEVGSVLVHAWLCVHMCARASVCGHVSVWAYVYMCECVHVCACVHIVWAYVNMCAHSVHVWACEHMCACVSVYTCVHACTLCEHMWTCVHIVCTCEHVFQVLHIQSISQMEKRSCRDLRIREEAVRFQVLGPSEPDAEPLPLTQRLLYL